MKNFFKIYFILTVVLLPNISQACDICGCSAGGMYVGILPQFQQNFVGLRYQFRQFDSKHIVNNYPVFSSDRFHSVELWGRFYPHRKVQVMAFMPLNIFSKDESNRITQTIGQGDLLVMANYLAVNTADTIISWWKHNLMVGGGLKLPTGEFNHYRNDSLLNPNLQSGTGSWDFLVNGNYTVRYKKIGLNIEANARFTTSNVHGYRFGHRFNGAMRLFMWTKIKKTSFVPHVGLLIDFSMKDRKKNLIVPETGGMSLSPQAGLDIYIMGKWMIGASVSHAMWENLGGGLISSGWRAQIQTSFLF
jgi:hypothetical protein